MLRRVRGQGKQLFINDRWGEILIPLYAPTYACESDVVRAMGGFIKDVLRQVE